MLAIKVKYVPRETFYGKDAGEDVLNVNPEINKYLGREISRYE